MASKKRQHFVPKLLLRRFAAREGRWRGHIFRFSKETGGINPAVPKTEAARSRYYDLPEDVVGEFTQPETILERIEDGAARSIRRLENHDPFDLADAVWLAYFAALQTVRTPRDRAERRYLDEVMEKQLQQMRFGARDLAVKALQKINPQMTHQQAEEERARIARGLETGEIELRSTADREVAGMFLGLDVTIEQLVAGCDWTLVEFPQAPALILPDTGYTQYDPSPRMPDSGSGFFGSPTAETVIAVRPDAALLITPGSGGLGHATGTPFYAIDLNLRAYAQSQSCVYGQLTLDVLHAHRTALREPELLHARRRRARTLWFIEGREGEPESGPFEAVGYALDGIKRQKVRVDPRARGDDRPHITAADLWG